MDFLEIDEKYAAMLELGREKQVDADRIYPGDGIAPLTEILTTLKNMGDTKILSLELFNRSYWQQDALEVAKSGLAKMKAVLVKCFYKETVLLFTPL